MTEGTQIHEMSPVQTILLLSFVFENAIFCVGESDAHYYENLINTETAKAKKYKLNSSAKRYEPTDDNVEDGGTYDFIVIGAGSAGSIVASRLSEISKWKVLLLEAGEFPNNFTSIPSMFLTVLNSDYNWAYKTVPQTTGCLGQINQECLYYRGRGVGGTSLVNNMVYSRGAPEDYDRWESMGNEGWSFEEVLPFFKKSEDFLNKNPIPDAPVAWDYHGTGGNIGVEYHYNTPLTDAFYGANKELGYHLIDNNGPVAIGDTPTPSNTRKGRRQDTGTTFIKPVLNRKNLKVLTGAYVTKIEINSRNIATGVKFTHNKKYYVAKATKEIILSAGAVGSPQILLHSGVGPKHHLRKVGVPLKKDLEVGSRLRDQLVYLGLMFSTNFTLPNLTLKQQVEEFLKGTGTLTVSGSYYALGFYQSSLEKTPNYPDIELQMIPPSDINTIYSFGNWTPETFNATWGDYHSTSSFVITVIMLHSYSYGTVRLNSSNPFEYPLIDARPMSDHQGHDLEVLYEGIQFVLKLAETKSFKKWDTKLAAKPIPQCCEHEFHTKEYWYCAMRYIGLEVYHPVGSCMMGPDPKKAAVVDSKLRVHGIRKLRVADASVIPLTTSGHTNAPSMMVGEKAADIIKKEYQNSS